MLKGVSPLALAIASSFASAIFFKRFCLHPPRAFAVKLMRQGIPSLLGCEAATKFIVVNDIDVGLVVLE